MARPIRVSGSSMVRLDKSSASGFGSGAELKVFVQAETAHAILAGSRRIRRQTPRRHADQCRMEAGAQGQLRAVRPLPELSYGMACLRLGIRVER